MRYNTVVAKLLEAQQQLDGDYLAKGYVVSTAGEDYRPHDAIQVIIKQEKLEYLNDLEPGTYLLERMDKESGYCLFPSLIKDGRTAIPALIGPLQVAWKDSGGRSHLVTLNKDGLEKNALHDADQAAKRFADSLRVFRDIIELEEDTGSPLGSVIVPTNRWKMSVAELIEEYPTLGSVIVRDRERATLARLTWDKETQSRVLVDPKHKDGRPVTFNGEEVEIIPIQQVSYLSNRFNPKKSSAMAAIKAEVDKSDRQLSYDAKIYPKWGSFATGIAVLRDLPSGGHTIDRVAASFPTRTFREVPGAFAQVEKTPDQANVAQVTRGLLQSLGIPEEMIQEVLKAAIRRPGPTHPEALEAGVDTRPGLPQEDTPDRIQAAAKAARNLLQPAEAAKPAAQANRSAQPAAATAAASTAAENRVPAASSAPTPAETKPAPVIDPNVRTRPRVQFGKKR